MVTYIFFIACLNLALGFFFTSAVNWLKDRRMRRPEPEEQDVEVAEAPAPEQTEETVVEVSEEPTGTGAAKSVPPEWSEILKAEGIEVCSFVEATCHILQLEVDRYREQLIRLDDKTRASLPSPTAADVAGWVEATNKINQDWLGEQNSAVEQLTNQPDLGDYSQAGEMLEATLLDQAAQIETTCNNLEQLDVDTDPQQACHRLIVEIGRLADLAHSLRDTMQTSIAAILREENRLGAVEDKLIKDNSSDLLNRIGLEGVFADWWSQDQSRHRTLSVAMIDIDRFSRINERYGLRVGDRALASMAELVNSLIRHDRGFDVAGRFGGQSFLLFYGDTGPRNATSASERVRQTVEATTFEYDEKEFVLTLSFGVCECLKDDDTQSLFDRAKKCVAVSKQKGRNRTSLCENGEFDVVEPPQYQVKGRLVVVKKE